MLKYNISVSEQVTLKVLKKQKEELSNLQKAVNKDYQEGQIDAKKLIELRNRFEILLNKRGLKPVPQTKTQTCEPLSKIPINDIPSWKQIAEEAKRKFPNEINFEDLLSREEIQLCIDDVQRINEEFSVKTGIINNKDMSFLMIATALQTARWLIIQNWGGDIGQTVNIDTRIPNEDGDKLKHPTLSKFQKKAQKHDNITGKYPSWQEILWGTYPRTDGEKSKGHCPYDAQDKAPSWFNEGGRGAHRSRTLGHDAIMGWIFGTANIMTQTITLTDFSSYKVTFPGNCFGDPVSTLSDVLGGAIKSTMEDWLRLPAAIVAHYAHLKSDIFTPAGLPVPLVGIMSNNLAGKLYKEQYDTLCLLKDANTISNQAVWNIFINMTIGLVHGLLYNPKEDGDRELYEVRTRKILCISNALASAGNITYVLGTENWKKLDAGGIMITLYRLFTDIRFISHIKKKFIEDEMDKVLENEIKALDAYFIE